MILVDVSQIIIANVAVMQFSGRDRSVTVDDALIKHMVINSLRIYNNRFKREYGDMVICCDHRKTWRKQKFQYYKSKRHESKEESDFDWGALYETMNKTLEDIKNFFPYKVLKIEGCEADDIIAELSRLEGKHVIISGDKDLTQLTNENVKQFHPINKKFISEPDIKAYLKELVIRGDKGDGVPNILSDDDVFVNGGRQKPISATKLGQWLRKEPKEFCENNRILRNYERNELLIDLNKTPDDLKAKIREEYGADALGNKQTIQQYFMANRMRNLLEVIEDF